MTASAARMHNARARPPAKMHATTAQPPLEDDLAIPLVVDLDGTLILTDMLHESAVKRFRAQLQQRYRLDTL